MLAYRRYNMLWEFTEKAKQEPSTTQNQIKLNLINFRMKWKELSFFVVVVFCVRRPSEKATNTRSVEYNEWKKKQQQQIMRAEEKTTNTYV